jgi:hypothetical protein
MNQAANQAWAAVTLQPGVPAWALVLLALLAAGAAGFSIWRGARGGWPRAAAFAVLLAYLAGPTLVRETRQGLRDIALLVVDRSASMQVGDRMKLADAAVTSLRAQAAHMPDLELRQVSVPEHGGSGTQLWSEVRRALADIPAGRLAGIIAVTDGLPRCSCCCRRAARSGTGACAWWRRPATASSATRWT